MRGEVGADGNAQSGVAGSGSNADPAALGVDTMEAAPKLHNNDAVGNGSVGEAEPKLRAGPQVRD